MSRPRPASARASALFSRPLAILISLTVAAVLSACGGLPTDSAVQQGSPVGEPAVQPVRVQPGVMRAIRITMAALCARMRARP